MNLVDLAVKILGTEFIAALNRIGWLNKINLIFNLRLSFLNELSLGQT
jgi:hypothetical protein